jgi:hypothetical protein
MDLLTLGSYAAGILLFMSTARLLLLNEVVGLPMLTYVSFSNILIYILHVMYSLARYILLTLLILIFRQQIYHIIQWIISDMSGDLFFISLMFIGFALAVMVAIRYWKYKIYDVKKLVIFIYMGIGLFGFVAKYYYHVKENNMLLFVMMFSFCWIYTRISIENEIRSNQNTIDFKATLNFKDQSIPQFVSNEKLYIITHTPDFVFIHNSDDKSLTTIPMSEIFSMNQNGTDNAAKAKIPRAIKKYGW